jgi:hypothetical protein
VSIGVAGRVVRDAPDRVLAAAPLTTTMEHRGGRDKRRWSIVVVALARHRAEGWDR